MARPFNDAGDASRTQHITPPASIQHAPPARRRIGDYQAFAVECWAARSAFTDSPCNCLGEAAHPKLNSRPTIKIVVGSWYIRRGAASAGRSDSSDPGVVILVIGLMIKETTEETKSEMTKKMTNKMTKKTIKIKVMIWMN